VLVCLLKVLFNGILQHGYIPHGFKFGVIIPLLKDANGDTTSADNYRGITLSSTISKLLELCLQSLFFDYLSTSNLQYGFKRNVGCTSAIYTLRSVIQYYNKRGSTVNLCMLDMSKAFDKPCDKRLGCYIGDVFCGCVMYADNLVLVSASVDLLQKMIDICCDMYLDMKFNALKSNIIRIGPRCSDLGIELFVNSVAIPCVNRVRYLGIYLLF